MDTNILETLHNYWFSEKESKIYITILEYGQALVSMISRKTGIKRTTLYGVLEELKTQGIVYEIVKNNIKYFSVISPDILFKQLEKKYISFRESLPNLMTLMGKFGDRPRVTFYEGKEQVEKMLYEHNDTRVTSMEDYDHIRRWYQDHHFVESYINRLRRYRTKMGSQEKIKLFTNKSAIEEKLAGSAQKVRNRIIRFLPKWFSFDSTLRVCGDYIIMIVLKDNKHYAYEIQDAVLWNNIRKIFQMLWHFIK